MPQPLLNVFEGDAVGQQQAGTAVTQIVKAHPAQTVTLQKFRKCVGQVFHPHPLAQLIHEYKAIVFIVVPLTEVQEDLKKLRDIRYWVRKATPGTEESKEPPKKQPIKEVLQDKADEKKAQRTAPEQTKHRQQDMEL